MIHGVAPDADGLGFQGLQGEGGAHFGGHHPHGVALDVQDVDDRQLLVAQVGHADVAAVDPPVEAGAGHLARPGGQRVDGQVVVGPAEGGGEQGLVAAVHIDADPRGSQGFQRDRRLVGGDERAVAVPIGDEDPAPAEIAEGEALALDVLERHGSDGVVPAEVEVEAHPHTGG